MNLTVGVILVLIALVLAIFSVFPAGDGYPLLAVAVILIAVALLVGESVRFPR